MRFRPEQHLRRQSDIKAVREKGGRVDCGAFTLWWLERSPKDTRASSLVSRVCVVASTAIVGNAVQRARAKRRLRECFRRNQDKVATGIDLMLLARKSINRSSFQELEARFIQACSRILPRNHA